MIAPGRSSFSNRIYAGRRAQAACRRAAPAQRQPEVWSMECRTPGSFPRANCQLDKPPALRAASHILGHVRQPGGVDPKHREHVFERRQQFKQQIAFSATAVGEHRPVVLGGNTATPRGKRARSWSPLAHYSPSAVPGLASSSSISSPRSAASMYLRSFASSRRASPRFAAASRASAARSPCLHGARRHRSNPSAVRGPVSCSPCTRHRPFGIAGCRHGLPFAFRRAPHRGDALAARSA